MCTVVAMPTVTFVGGPKHGETMAVRDLREVVEVAVADMIDMSFALDPSPIGPAFRVERYYLKWYIEPPARAPRPMYVHEGRAPGRVPRFTSSSSRASQPQLSPDAHSMSFANMTAEAEAELAAWRGILHPAE